MVGVVGNNTKKLKSIMLNEPDPEERFQRVQFQSDLPRYAAANNDLAKLRLFERGYDTYLRPFIKKLRNKLLEILGR